MTHDASDDCEKKMDALVHDLKGPLAIIQGFLEEMEKSALVPEDRRELLSYAWRALERVLMRLKEG